MEEYNIKDEILVSRKYWNEDGSQPKDLLDWKRKKSSNTILKLK